MTTSSIVAISTPPGKGGIAVIRMSGSDAISILSKSWKGKNLDNCSSHTAHFGKIINQDGEIIDEVVLTVFRTPKSFTGEDTVEISCHGSTWIQREIVNLLIRNGASAAAPGEFSQRAFLNGRLDLAQAEGIIDLISASSKAAHRLALSQADGRFSKRLEELREKLIEFASLLELELDFSEEDVEFADRLKLKALADEIMSNIKAIAETYSAGKAFKEGIPVVIAGAPNAGKSTLLNALLDEDKAIVSEIPGTTRDIIEDTTEIGGVLFRFADTAGLRDTIDKVEKIGIERANERLRKAEIILWTIDLTEESTSSLRAMTEEMGKLIAEEEKKAHHYILLNKIDQVDNAEETRRKVQRLLATNLCDHPEVISEENIIPISAKEGKGITELKERLAAEANLMQVGSGDIMITNARHYEALLRGLEALERASALITTGQSADFIAQDVREALHHLGEITGAITTPTLLNSIFSRFCIGK